MRFWFLIFFATVTLFAVDEFADDSFGGDESIEIVNTNSKESKNFDIYGSLSYSTSYNYAHKKPLNAMINDFRGFSSSKLSIDLNIKYRIYKSYQLRSTIRAFKDFIYDFKQDEYKEVPKEYDQYADINELYVDGKLNNNIDIRVGRQIVTWGKSDNIRITDILNPLDNTMPGMVDIKDLKLGRAMLKMDYFFSSKWSLGTIALFENRFSRQPQYGSDFAPSNKIKADMISVDEQNDSLENSGVAFVLNGNLEGQDISFYYVNQYMDSTTYRSNMLGAAYNIVMGSFLLKTEAAYFDNYDSNSSDAYSEWLVGAEYTGISDSSISFEMAKKNEYMQYAARATQSYINQTLSATVLFSLFGEDMKDGGFARVWSDYKYNDDITMTVGVIDYIGGNSPRFEQVKNNDRAFATFKYNF
jgi:hypothetical protein